MNLVKNLLSYFRRVFVVESASAMLPVRSESGESVGDADVLALSAAWACTRLLCGTIASLPLATYRSDGKGHKVVERSHPLYRLLHRAPNSEQTVVDFWEGGIGSIELKGNMLALKQRSVSGQVIGLVPMAWDWVRVTRPVKGGPLAYEYDGITYGPEDVLHIRGFGGSPEGGLSTVAFCAATFGIAKAANKTAARLFANGARPSGVLAMDERLSPDQRTELEELLEQKFTGSINAGRPMLLDGGLKWMPLTMNPDDAQLLQSRTFSVEEVCRIFGVPPHMIGHTEKTTSWGTGVEQQTLAFQKYTLRARLKRIETALEQQLLTPEDIAGGISIEFNLDGLLRGDSKGRAEVNALALRNGWKTINEVRMDEGLSPVEGGDVPRLQMQNVPITEAGNTLAP